MRKFLILSLVLLIGFSSLFLFPRVAGAGWSAPVGPYASDPAKPEIKDTISMTGVFSSSNSEISIRRRSRCFRSRGGESCIDTYAEKLTVITNNETIQIKWKNSQSVEFIRTISGKKEVYYYDCSNSDCRDHYSRGGWRPNTKTLTNYFYEPIPAQSSTFPFKLNNLILTIGGPECAYQYGKYQSIVDCTTFGLSADGRIGDARYHDSQSIKNKWYNRGIVNSFVNIATLGNVDLTNYVSSPNSVYAPPNYGTVENSNNLGVGGWTWSGFYGNSNSGFIIPPPVVDLRSSSQFEIRKPDNLASIELNWNSDYADSCSASGSWSGSKPLGDPTAVFETLKKPRGNYKFALSCQNMVGSTSDSVAVQAVQLPQCSFSSDKSSIILPDSATLSLSCDYADSCSIDQSVGGVCSSQTDCSDDNVKVRPTKTTTFTLTCQGLDGQRQWQTTVGVGGPGEIKYKEVIPQ